MLGPVLQSIATCITHPTVAGCLAAAGQVVLLGTSFADIGADAAADGSLGEAAASCGGMSFTAGTKVLLANGRKTPISRLRRGQKVRTTNTRTGQDQAGTIAAVLVHHDTNLYDLRVRSAGQAAVIGTTTTHLFWDATTATWVKAAALRHGTLLRTPGGGTATVLGGYIPATTTGWMWDLTIVSDHDFYISAGSTTVLVHNCGTIPARSVRFTQDSISQSFRDGRSVMQLGEDLTNGTISPEALPPIRLFERNGNLYSLDNRRFLAGQMADVELPYRMATPEEVAAELPKKFTTQNEGTGIYVRRVGYFSWSQP